MFIKKIKAARRSKSLSVNMHWICTGTFIMMTHCFNRLLDYK